MWQHLLSHSWNHSFSEAQCLRLLHCTLGGVVEDNMLDFFVSSLAPQIPGHAVWGPSVLTGQAGNYESNLAISFL